MSETTNTNTSSSNPSGQSQYRATRIWYEIVHSFYANVTLKKHWRNFRTYQDCFAASEAIDWLFSYLKSSPNFKSHTSITRQQAIQLLQIFLKEKIIEDVRASNEKYVFKPFADDDRLYKFNTSHRLYLNRPTNSNKPNETDLTNESTSSKQTNQTTDVSTSNVTDTEASTTQTGFNEKSVDPIETKFDQTTESKQLSESLSKLELDKENSNKLKQSTRSHHHHNNKLENEIWNKSVHEMLDSIINKAILNSIQTEFHQKSSKKPRRSLNLNTDNLNEIELNLDELLYEGKIDLTKNKTTGSYINHNCNHINKHGVVTETDDDFPPWLVKAMTTLLKWRQERNEFPKFEDVFAEINNYFNDMNEPLLTKDISQLLFRIMKLLLLPQYYVPNLIENDEYVELECSVMHEKNTKIFENVMKNLSHHLVSNQSFQVNEFLPYGSNILDYDEEEAHLLENAKLPIIPNDPNESAYNPGCCEDCEMRHNLLNNFINTSAIEFNEFVSSINDLGIKDHFDLLKLTNNEDFVDFVDEEEEEEQYDEFDPDTNTFKLKQAEDKFSRLKLNSPFKPKKSHHKSLNRSLAKQLSEKRLHRNNSFRAAIGEIGSFLKTPSIVPTTSTIQSQKSPDIINDQKSVKELLKKFDEAKQYDSNIECNLVKSCSMNSIQTNNQTLTEDDESFKSNRIDAMRKRKLADAFQSFSRTQRLNTFNSLNNFGMTPSLPRNYSFDNQKIENSFMNSTLPRLSMSSLKSYNDLCNIMMKSNTASLNNLTDENLIEIKNKSKSRLSSYSINTLNSIILNTMNTGSVQEKEIELKQKKKAFTKKLNLTSEIESETLCFMISAFRLCALMLPPANKRKLHLLLRFLYKLRCDHNSAKYLLGEQDSVDNSSSTRNDYEDLHFIDSSIINSSGDFLNLSKQNDYASFCLSSTSNQRVSSFNHSFANNKPKLDLKEMESKSKAVEKFIIKSFFKSIVFSHNNLDKDEEEEHHLLGMKLIQILINHYPEVMRIPDELVKNVNTSLTAIKQTKVSCQIGNTTKMSLQQYDKQTAEISKQHLAELLNSILTDMSIKDEDKLQRLKKFKDVHPQIYEEKYSTIKKALNILGLNNSAAFLVPNIDKPSKNYYLDDISNRRDSTYIKKRTHMAKLTESARKKTSSSSNTFQMNQTIMSIIQPSSSNSSIGLPKFFLNKLKKENNL